MNTGPSSPALGADHGVLGGGGDLRRRFRQPRQLELVDPVHDRRGRRNPSAPSARAQVVNQSAFANKTLAQTYPQVCMSVNVNLASGNNVDLLRLRTAANGPIIKAFVSSTNTLTLRSDVSGTQLNSGVALGSGWHTVELCGTVGCGHDLGPVPRRRPHRERLVREHRHHADRVDPDRRQRREDLHDEHGSRPGRPGTRREQQPRKLRASDRPGSTHRTEPHRRHDPDRLGRFHRRVVADHLPRLPRRRRVADRLDDRTSFTDQGLAAGSIHTYTVDAIDAIEQRERTQPRLGADHGVRRRRR